MTESEFNSGAAPALGGLNDSGKFAPTRSEYKAPTLHQMREASQLRPLDWNRSQLAFHRAHVVRLVGKLRKERAWQAELARFNPGAGQFFTAEEALLIGDIAMHRKAMQRAWRAIRADIQSQPQKAA